MAQGSHKLLLMNSLLVVGIGLLIAGFIPGFGATDLVAYAGKSMTVPGEVKSIQFDQGATITLPAKPAAPQGTTPDAPPPDTTFKATVRPGRHTLSLDGTSHDLLAINPAFGVAAGLGMVLVFLTVPYALFKKTDAWSHLLVEPDGGYSLGRIQLLIWFLPAMAIYTVLSIPLHEFAVVPDTVWIMLGLGTATATISTAVTGTKTQTPTQAPQTSVDSMKAAMQAAAPSLQPDDLKKYTDALDQVNQSIQQQAAGTQGPAAVAQQQPAVAQGQTHTPSFIDMLEDWQGQGDASRYQYLVLCVIGATILVTAFFRTWTVPDLPQQFLYLVLTSQAAYVGVKAVKQNQS